MPLRVKESNRPVFVPESCDPETAHGVWDDACPEFLNDGTDIAWQSMFVPWASAQGFQSVSLFGTQVWIWYDAMNLGKPVYWQALAGKLGGPSYLSQTTITGQTWSTSAQRLTSLQGGAKTSGMAHLSH